MANIFFIFKSDTEFVAPTTSALSNAIATNDAFNRDPRNSYSITAASLNTAADVLDTLDDSSSKALNRLAGFAGKAAPYLGIIQVGIKAFDPKQKLELADVMTLGASLGVLIGSAPLAVGFTIAGLGVTLLDKALDWAFKEADEWLEDHRKGLNDLHPSLDQAERTSSPIVIDMNGDGIHASKLAEGLDKAVHFDLDGNGFAEKTAWIDASDALLVLDKNANGRIDNGHELFGNHSLNAEGKKAFADGYAALAAYDENQDGRIDAQDAVYAQLAVWQDKNGNGISEEGEMLGLAEAGIAAIDLNAKAVNERDTAGNRISHRGSVAMAEFDKSTSYGAANAVYWKSQTVRDLDSHTAQAIYATKAEYIVLALEERIKADGSVKTDLTYDEYAGASRQANEDHEFKGIKTIHDTPHEINAAPHVKVMTF